MDRPRTVRRVALRPAQETVQVVKTPKLNAVTNRIRSRMAAGAFCLCALGSLVGGIRAQLTHSTDLSRPLAEWELAATSKTNGAVISILPGKHFFVVRALSDFWGASSA